MQEYKIWALAIPTITESEIIWMRELGVEVNVETLTSKVYLSGQISKQYVTGHKIEIITTCEKQEMMLQLKYSKELYLKEHGVKVPYENFDMVSHSRSPT